MSIYYEDLDELLSGLRVIEADTDIQANSLQVACTYFALFLDSLGPSMHAAVPIHAIV
jgi:hypothetical protein